MSEAIRSALAALLRRIGPGNELAVCRRLSGGASQETWLAELADGSRCILRRAPDIRWKSDLATGLATEALLMQRAGMAGVPSPAVLHVLAPEDGLGEGFVMGFVAGETLGQKIVRDPAFAAVRPALAGQCGRVLAAIHRIEAADIPGLRLKTNRSKVTELADALAGFRDRRPVFELALSWLAGHVPEDPARPALVHGDFRNGNLIVGPDGLRAVLDWELAHLGDPREDLGWIAVNSWRFGEIDRPVGGFGTREDLYAAYAAAGGGTVDPAAVRFFEVLGTLRWGVICASNADQLDLAAANAVERCIIGRRASETELDLLNLLTEAA